MWQLFKAVVSKSIVSLLNTKQKELIQVKWTSSKEFKPIAQVDSILFIDLVEFFLFNLANLSQLWFVRKMLVKFFNLLLEGITI